jgi:glycerate 2-kinase
MDKIQTVKKYITNHDALASHGNTASRKVSIDILEHALEAANPYSAVMRMLKLDGDEVTIGGLQLNLNDYERIFILGAGKASLGIAQALEDLLGDRISDGLFVLKQGSQAELQRARVIYASHPYPDENSHLAGQGMMALAKTFTENDLVFAGITGGSSALLVLPVEELTFEEIRQVNQVLILSGADIFSINCVRKHLSRIKGGWLADQIFPATLVNLTVSDVVGDKLDYITDPTVSDTSTFDDARRVMDAYNLWDEFPASVSAYLRNADDLKETPKDFGEFPLHTFVISPGDAACVGAFERAEELGLNAMILTSTLTGEAREAGTIFASIGKEILDFGRPLRAPCAVIAGGENVVTIGANNYGCGGPNLEFALSAAVEIAGLGNIVVSSIDTDGLDGITQTAGGMVDGFTLADAMERGLDPIKALNTHDTEGVISRVGDAVITGLTGTNVNDLKLLLVI